ncbi:hypothetical protein DERF_009796 [Dermatophagoides farinae]|uniref:Uncharacterized protein n=1 Tax=Dermatophagoides farinae TaxID=6954 RepID=A0A922L2W7_DERFA|nr:hypothetical protein DERF_009796 [Dermatophagoides farinae]
MEKIPNARNKFINKCDHLKHNDKDDGLPVRWSFCKNACKNANVMIRCLRALNGISRNAATGL